MIDLKVIKIDKGNTEKGVNHIIIEWIFKNINKKFDILDIPCGKGVFIKNLEKICENLNSSTLIDKFEDLKIDYNNSKNQKFLKLDINDINLIQDKFDIITSISGVMEYDNISGFIEKTTNLLYKGGYLIISNDNIISLKDRIYYLLFGKVRRFRLLLEPHQPTFHNISIQEIHKYLIENNYEIVKIEYCSYRLSDIIFFILFFYIYIIQIIYILFIQSYVKREIRYNMFPIKSLFCRHYIIFSRLKNNI